MNENFEMEKISKEILEHQEQIIESLSYEINEIILRVNDLDSKILKIIKYLKHD